MKEIKLEPEQFTDLTNAVVAALSSVVSDSKRVGGVATVNQALHFAGVKSRTTLLQWERDGVFPKRMSLHGERVGYLWSDLIAWRDALKEAN